jgi:hypothetical protein
MMLTINTARPSMAHVCTFFGMRPGGFGALSWIGWVAGELTGSVMGSSHSAEGVLRAAFY